MVTKVTTHSSRAPAPSPSVSQSVTLKYVNTTSHYLALPHTTLHYLGTCVNRRSSGNGKVGEAEIGDFYRVKVIFSLIEYP
jgi:hypothetical protein